MKIYAAIFLAFLVVTTAISEKDIDCNNALTTLEINECASIELQSTKAELAKYLEVTYEHNAYDSELIDAIKAAQNDWQIYMLAHCDSVYTQWRDGTIRGVMVLLCKTKLTRQRTYEIWSNFLTYMDSTPPVLPEPEN